MDSLKKPSSRLDRSIRNASTSSVRTSMMVYKRTTKSLATIGRELGADYLVESSVRVEGDRLRITARLVRADDQVQMWSRA